MNIEEAITCAPVFDLHTHLYDPSFGLTLWGIDELLTYHYLVAETLRFAAISPESFFSAPKREQADLVWKTLFVERTPISEACAGVLTVLQELGFDPNGRDLREPREYFATARFEEHLERVLELANVKALVMTNDPFDPREAPNWPAPKRDPRFHAALRIDPILGGMSVGSSGAGTPPPQTPEEARTFLERWVDTLRPLYMAASLPPDFKPNAMLMEAILPTCERHGIPFAMMIGVRKRVNPRLGDAGDSVGFSYLGTVEQLCRDFPNNRFLVTVLARENQQALCVAARKFANLLPFGCWWFMNNPSLVEETTRLRLEMLGTSFVPQHSDARVLEQVIYKWKHAKRSIGRALESRYRALEKAGRQASQREVECDVRTLLHDNAVTWLKV